jgi:type III secretion protein T
MDALQPLLADPGLALTWAAVGSLRVGVALALLPPLAARLVPGMARAAIALALAIPIIAPRLGMPLPTDFSAWSLLVLVLREAAIGLAIGLAFGAFCAAFETVGEFIDHQTGLTFTQNIDPIRGNQEAVTGQFMERVFLTVLMVAGLMVLVADALYLSYRVWPLGQPIPRLDGVVPLALLDQTHRLFAFALLLAGPVLLVLFVIDASFGLLNRAAPEIPVYQITLSIKPLVGLAVLAAALPALVQQSVVALGTAARVARSILTGA